MFRLSTITKMPSRVTPNKSCVIDIPVDPTSVAAQPATNDVSLGQSTLNDGNVNEEVLQVIEAAYRPVLRLMKLFGAYFGDTSFNSLVQVSSRRRNESYISRFYCAVVVAGLWFNFAMPLVSIFFGENIYLIIMFISWCLLVALMGTTCLIVLPITFARKSRLENFLRKVIAVHIGSAFLEKIKSKARVYLIVFSLALMACIVGLILSDVVLGINIGNLEPWNSWFGFKITNLVFLTCSSGVCCLPVSLFCITCSILEALFDDLHKRMSSPQANSMGLTPLRREHQNLCQVVEMADSMLSPLLLEVVTFFIPIICFNFHQVVNYSSRQEGTFVFLFVTLFWLLISSASLAVIMILGSRVSEKVRKELNFTVKHFFSSHFWHSRIMGADKCFRVKVAHNGFPHFPPCPVIIRSVIIIALYYWVS